MLPTPIPTKTKPINGGCHHTFIIIARGSIIRGYISFHPAFPISHCRSEFIHISRIYIYIIPPSQEAMSMRYSYAFALAVVVVAALVVGSALATPNTNFVSSACNTQKIPSGSSFYSTLGSLLVDLEGNTAFSGYDYKASRAGSPTAYGRGVCNQGISQSDCTACLKNLGDRIWNICGNAIGARVQLTDCFIRYEQYSF